MPAAPCLSLLICEMGNGSSTCSKDLEGCLNVCLVLRAGLHLVTLGPHLWPFHLSWSSLTLTHQPLRKPQANWKTVMFTRSGVHPGSLPGAVDDGQGPLQAQNVCTCSSFTPTQMPTRLGAHLQRNRKMILLTITVLSG